MEKPIDGLNWNPMLRVFVKDCGSILVKSLKLQATQKGPQSADTQDITHSA